VAAESTKFRDCKGNKTDIGATPHPLRVLLELGLLNTASSDFGRRGARNAKQTVNHGIKSKFSASDAVIGQASHICGEAVVAVRELN
jgi:hypothetical protein